MGGGIGVVNKITLEEQQKKKFNQYNQIMENHNMKSINPYDVYKWVEKCINSCISSKQLCAVNRLIINFENMFGGQYNDLSICLRMLENARWIYVIDTEENES